MAGRTSSSSTGTSTESTVIGTKISTLVVDTHIGSTTQYQYVLYSSTIGIGGQTSIGSIIDYMELR